MCNVRDYGATGDGITYDDDAFSLSFQSCRGGQVRVPAGTYLLSPFNLSSNTELYLEAGSTLLATTDFSKWQVVAPLPSYPDQVLVELIDLSQLC